MGLYGIVLTNFHQFFLRIHDLFQAEGSVILFEEINSEQSCLEKLETRQADLLIIYHSPPSINAPNFLRLYRAHHFSGQVLVIIPPKYEQDANQCIIEEAFGYLIDNLGLDEALAHLIRRKLPSLIPSRSGSGEEFPSLTYEKLTILDRISSYVAHELKNPFTTINNALYFLKKKISEQSDPIFQKYLSIIETEIILSNRFLSNLVCITQEPILNLSAVDLAELIQKVLEQLPISKKITIAFASDSILGPIFIDREQIEMAFLQIIRNALQAMPEGGELTIQLVDKQEGIEVLIVDQGGGIKESDLTQVFEPFFTTKPRRVGLGLTFAKKIIEAHQGHISFESVFGQGTKCILFLPKRR